MAINDAETVQNALKCIEIHYSAVLLCSSIYTLWKLYACVRVLR